MKVTPRPISGYAGLRNVSDAERFEPGDLVRAQNVELDNTGKIRSRAGMSRVATGEFHSLWCGRGRAYVVLGDELHEFTPPDLRALGVSVERRLSYTEVGNTVYWSDGVSTGALDDGEPRPWGLPVPSPVSVSIGAGELAAGDYQVSVVGVDRYGMEGGASEPVAVTLAEASAMSVNIPALEGAAGVHLYVSSPDGELMYLRGSYAPGIGAVTISALDTGTLPLRTAGRGPAPAGETVRRYHGWALVAAGNVLWHSVAGEPELFDLAAGFHLFEHAITVLAPVGKGVFVATERDTFFLAGADPENWQLDRVATSGAVRGSEVFPEAKNLLEEGVPGSVALWLDSSGICLGLDNGEIRNLTGARWVPATASSAAALMRDTRGLAQYLCTTFNQE